MQEACHPMLGRGAAVSRAAALGRRHCLHHPGAGSSGPRLATERGGRVAAVGSPRSSCRRSTA